MEAGLGGEPGPRVLADVEQQLGAGSGPVMTLLPVTMACTVMVVTIRPWPAVLQGVSVKIPVRYLLET